jgi:hypothetical protein
MPQRGLLRSRSRRRAGKPSSRAAVPAPTEIAEAWAAMPHVVARERETREALRRHPERGLLARDIGRAIRRLLPQEVEELRRLVTSLRFALAMKLREAVREATLGHDGREQ